jgi:tetratricopeptide (TPR) repeat protein
MTLIVCVILTAIIVAIMIFTRSQGPTGEKLEQQSNGDPLKLMKAAGAYGRKNKTGDQRRVLLAAAEAYRKQGFHLKVVALYKQLTAWEPEKAVLHLALAETYMELANIDGAKAAVEQALKFEPGNAKAAELAKKLS